MPESGGAEAGPARPGAVLRELYPAQEGRSADPKSVPALACAGSVPRGRLPVRGRAHPKAGAWNRAMESLSLESEIMIRWLRWGVLAALVTLLMATPTSQAQTPPSTVSIYSIWVKLSLRGYSQEEIESILRNMDAKTIDDVKTRLRKSVLSNLRLKRVQERFQSSRDKGDLQDVLSSVETEIRFAGLENDEELKFQIRERFGIPLDRM
jgi:hypothetical protein